MPQLADNSLRQAAVFIRSLDADAAATMLARLSSGEARALRSAIRELGEVAPDERRRVAEQLTPESSDRSDQRADAEPAKIDESIEAASGGVELALSDSASAGAASSDTAYEAPDVKTPAPAEPSAGECFAKLQDADPQAIFDYLVGEQPRAAALILSHLPPALAAGVLELYPASEQPGLLAQLAAQDEADPDSVRVLATGLADWVAQQQLQQQRRSGGLAAIRRILAATPESTRGRLCAQLAESAPELVESLPARPAPPKDDRAPVERSAASPAVMERPRPVATAPRLSFEQLDQVDARALASGVASLDPRTALLALAAASPAVVDRLAEAMPKAAARDLRRRLHRVGPTTLREIDRAQATFASAVSRIVMARRRGVSSRQEA